MEGDACNELNVERGLIRRRSGVMRKKDIASSFS
jgi:hypothetical protein